MFFLTLYHSPLGAITLASDGDNLVGLWLAGQKYFAATIPGPLTDNPGLPVFTATKAWLKSYFAGQNPAISSLSLAPAGSTFRKTVWDRLCAIPYGQCVSYGKIAKELSAAANKKNLSSQAVGNAVGHNPISIIIPCHRVIGANGSLTGYAGGIHKKMALLKHEGVDCSRFFIPDKGTAL